MLATDIKIENLVSFEACSKAIDAIGNDHRNIVGGLDAWNSSCTTRLTTEAQAKVKAIELHQATRFSKYFDAK